MRKTVAGLLALLALMGGAACAGPRGPARPALAAGDDDDDDAANLACDAAAGDWAAHVMAPAGDEVYPVGAVWYDAAGAGQELDAAALRPGGAAVKLEAGTLVLDFGQIVGGYIELGAASAEAFSFTLRFAESYDFLFDTQLTPFEILTQFTTPFVWLPAYHRLQLDGAQELRDPQAVGAFRYVRLDVAGGTAELDWLRAHFTAFRSTPERLAGYFLCDDELLNRIWYAGLYTLDLTTIASDQGGAGERLTIGDGAFSIVDGGKRDRLIWSGDLSIANAVDFVARADHTAALASLDYLGDRQRADGALPACSTAGLLGLSAFTFLEYEFFWALTAWDQYVWTGDATALARRYAVTEKLLAYAGKQVSGGLLSLGADDAGSWCWTLDRQGQNAFHNILYQFSLQRAAAMAAALGKAADANNWQAAADRLATAIDAALWDDARGVYVESAADRVHVPLDANAMAILAGVAGDRAGRIFAYIDAHLGGSFGYVNVDPAYEHTEDDLDFHNRRSIGFVNAFAAQALLETGRVDEALALLRACFGHMAQTDPASTMWEFIGGDGKPEMAYVSLAHAWSAGATALLTTYVLGIKPLTPGFGRYEIQPQLGGLQTVEGRVGTPQGAIFVKLQVVEEGLLAYVEGPASAVGEFVVPAEYASWRALSGDATAIAAGRVAVRGVACLLATK
jgi:hypothetical protein